LSIRSDVWLGAVFLLSFFVIFVVIALVIQVELPDEIVTRIEDYFVLRESVEPSVIAAAFVLGAISFHTPLKIFLRYFATVVHELGHAFMAGLLLARPKSIQIHPSSSGLAIYELSPNWGRFRASLVSAAGYPAPGLAALAALHAVQEGYAIPWTIFALSVLAVAIIFLIRNVWGFLWTSSIVVATFFGISQLSVQWVAAGAVYVAGFIALSGIEFAWIQVKLVRKSPGSGVDAESISHYLGISPRLIAWCHLWISLVTSSTAGFYAIQPFF